MDILVFSDFSAGVQGVSVDLSDPDGVVVDIPNKLKITVKPDLLSSGDAFGIEGVAGTDLDDTIIGNARSNLLFGLGGNDLLVGGDGRDIIVGGDGADTLSGGNGEDLLIAGNLAFNEDVEFEALLAIHAEWNSDRDYEDRVANLSGTGDGPRDNGDYFLVPGDTVFADVDVDELTGGENDLDWYLYTFFEDFVTDLEEDEEESNLAV